MSNFNGNYEMVPTVVAIAKSDDSSNVSSPQNDVIITTLNALTMENEKNNSSNKMKRGNIGPAPATPPPTTPATLISTSPAPPPTPSTVPIANPLQHHQQQQQRQQLAKLIQRPTTPIPAKKFTAKKPINLNLKISKSKQYAETENATLSNTAIIASSSSSCCNSSNLTTPAAAATAAATNAATPSSSSSSASTSSSTTTTSATIFPYEQNRTIKKLDIGFANISYSAKTGFFKRENKDILNGLTGKFHAGEISGIVGPSGAGKSTFLNILSSYTSFGYSGDITINGNIRDIKAFKPNVAFITQDTSLQPFLTVKEAMHFAANLKIGTHMTKSERRERVGKILEAISMYENRHTRTGNLSGGQKKRLAIALELVNNPPVLILDEPTSGLDSSTSNQVISLLKKLAMEGRTIICTIHQPSALTFKIFDYLYAIAEGKCIYSGATQNLVPFLAEAGLHCPESYNPADYLMEIATDDYGKQNYKLVEKIENGRNESYRQDRLENRRSQIDAIKKIDKMMEAGLMTPVTAPILTPNYTNNIYNNYHQQYDYHNNQKQHQNQQQHKQLTPITEMSSKIWDSRGILNEHEQNTKEQQQQQQRQQQQAKSKPKIQIDASKLCKRENIYATPFYRQLAILLVRTFLILWRDSSLTTMIFVIHFFTALLIGFLYYNIGNNAANAMDIFHYCFYVIMFTMYCAFSSILVKFPLEFPIVSREHFNRWYSLRAYYIAITLADIPIQMISSGLFIFTTYFLTGQPLEVFRVCLFSLIIFLTALVGQSIGLAVGASLSVKLGAIFGPFFISPFLVFSGFFLQHKDAPRLMQWIFDISFLRYGLDGAMLALFGYDRPKLECPQVYCHFNHPNYFLKYLDMEQGNYETDVIFLIVVFLGLRTISFYIMSFRLRLFR